MTRVSRSCSPSMLSVVRLDTTFAGWPVEPWTMGGYSYSALGEVCGVGSRLNEPWQQQPYFAGEHDCPPFFMEGALQIRGMDGGG